MKSIPAKSSIHRFLRLAGSKLKFSIYLLFKLPSAFFAGIRVEEISCEHAAVTVPYTWFSKNPFRSTYFACLAMGAEMSTGLLAMMYTYGQSPGVSMLIVNLEAYYHKKATGITKFVCNDGGAAEKMVQLALDSGEPQTLRMQSVGRNQQGELVAEFYITWSFKVKTIC